MPGSAALIAACALAPPVAQWLTERCAALAALAPDAAVVPLATALGQAARRCGAEAGRVVPSPTAAGGSWTVLHTARSALLLALDARDPDAWLVALDEVLRHADLGEQVAFYQALPLLPHGDLLAPRAAVGIRSSITDVVAAVAHGNPYPAAHLDDGAWNQLVLKCLFSALGLDPVLGLDARANPVLAGMLRDYARERRAAGRPVHPELWRCLALHADDAGVELLLAAAAAPDPAAGATASLGQEAARLALLSCPHPGARGAPAPAAESTWPAIHTATRRILS